jgi:hypothetical protein
MRLAEHPLRLAAASYMPEPSSTISHRSIRTACEQRHLEPRNLVRSNWAVLIERGEHSDDIAALLAEEIVLAQSDVERDDDVHIVALARTPIDCVWVKICFGHYQSWVRPATFSLPSWRVLRQ